METPILEDESSDPNEESKNVKSAVDAGRYLEEDDNNNVAKDRYSGRYPNRITSPTEELHKSNQLQTFSQYPEDFKESLDDTNVGTHDFTDKQKSLFSINVQQYLGHMVDRNVKENPDVNDVDQFEPYETYEANKEIQRLMEQISDDEEEPVKPLVPRQTIEVVLVDETKKKKKKKSKKQRDPDVDNMMVGEPVVNNVHLQESATVEIKLVPEKKERVDTKEIAVQTMPVPDDLDSEDDSDQDILHYQQRSAIGGYLINTIPEEQEDESPLSTPDQNKFPSVVQEQIHRERGFLFRDTRDQEPTPRHPPQSTEKPTYSDAPVLPPKYFSEPTIVQNEAMSVDFSPDIHDQLPQTREAYKTPKKQPNEHEKDQIMTISHPSFTVDSLLSDPTDERATEMSKPWQNEFAQVGHREQYKIHPHQPEYEKAGFEFDGQREDFESSPTSRTEDFSKTIYKPKFDIQDFVEEDKRRQNGVVIQAPPSKKHKMSSPHSPIDNTLLEGELHQREETIPVAREPEVVEPLYQPKYEVHDFIKQDVQKQFEPIKTTSARDVLLEEEAKEETPYPDSDLDGHGVIRTPYQLKYQKREDPPQANGYAIQQEDGLKPTQLDYQPRYEISEFIRNQQPKVDLNAEPIIKEGKSEPIFQKYEARIELTDMIAKEENKGTEKSSYLETVQTRETILIVQEEPEPLFYQPKYEIKNFVLEEEPGNVDKAGDHEESDTDDSSFEDIPEPIQSAYKPRYILVETPKNETQKVQPMLEEKKDIHFDSTREEITQLNYQPRYEIRELKQNDEHKSQQYIEKDLPDGSLENIPSRQLKKGPESIGPVHQAKYKMRDFVLQELPDEETQPVLDEGVNTTAVSLDQKEPDVRLSSYQPRYKINDVVLEDQSENKAKPTKPLRVKNRITASPPFVEGEAALAEERQEPENISPAYQPQYEIRNFVLEEQPHKPEEPKLIPAESLLVEEEPEPTRSFRRPKIKVDDFVLEKEPQSTDKPIFPVPDDKTDTSPVPEEEQESNRLSRVPKYQIKDSVLVEEPKTKDQNVAVAMKKELKRTQPRKEMSFVLEEEPEKKGTPSYPTAATIVEKESEIKRYSYKPNYEISDTLDEEAACKNKLFEPMEPKTTIDSTRPTYAPKYEINDFVLVEEPESKPQQHQILDVPSIPQTHFIVEEQPENDRPTKRPVRDKTIRPASVPVVEEEPKPTYAVPQTKKIREFVLEESAKKNERQQLLSDEDVNVTVVNDMQEEPEITRSFHQPKYEINDFMHDDEEPEPNRLDEDGNLTRSKYEIGNFVIEEHPENKKRKTEHPVTDERVDVTQVSIVEKEPEPNYDALQPRKMREIVIQEEPKGDLAPDVKEPADITESPLVEQEPEIKHSHYKPQYVLNDFILEENPPSTVTPPPDTILEEESDFYRPFELREEVKTFVLDEGPLIKRGQSKQHEVPVALKEPNFTRSVNSPNYDIPDLETQNKVIDFVIEEQPVPKRAPKPLETDETVKPSTEPMVEDEPDFYRPFETRHEVKAFVFDDGPLIDRNHSKPPEKTKTDEAPVALKEPDFTGSVSSPKYDIPDLETQNKVIDFAIEEQPVPKRAPKPLATDETVEPSTEPMVEDEPDFYRPFETRHEVKSFVLDDGPLIDRDHSNPQEKTKTDEAPVALKEPDFTRSVSSPKYDIPDLETQDKAINFVIEEQPVLNDAPKPPATDETVETSTEPMVEEEPDFFRPFETRHEVKSFVLDDGPLIDRDQSKPQEKTKTDEAPVALKEPDFTRSVSSQKYNVPDLETQNKVIDFVIEEQPVPNDAPKPPATDETIETSTEPMVEEEPDFYRPFETRHEVKAFVLDDGPLIGRDQSKRQEKAKTDETPVALKEPDFTRSVSSPKYDIPDLETQNKVIDFVIEEQPVPNDAPKPPATDETAETSTEPMVEEQPYFYRQFETRHEVKAFVLDDGPLIDRDQSKRQEKTKTDETPIALKEPDFTRSVSSPKYDIPDLETQNKVIDFVIEEQPVPNGAPKPPATDETSAEPMVEEEPDFYRPFETRHEVKAFVLDDGPPIDRDQSKRQEKTKTDEALVGLNEPKFTRSVNSLKYEIPDVTLDDRVQEEPEYKYQLETHMADNKVNTHPVPLDQKGPSIIQAKNKARGFVIEEQQENEGTLKHPVVDEKVSRDSVPVVEEEPERTYSVPRPKTIREFILKEEPENERPRKLSSDENMNVTAVKLVHKKPKDSERPDKQSYPVINETNTPTQSLTRQEERETSWSSKNPEQKSSKFVLIDKPTKEDQQTTTVSDDVDGHTAPLVETEPDVVTPKYEIRSLVEKSCTTNNKPEKRIKVSSLKVQGHTGPSYQQTYSLKDLILIEETERYGTAVNPPIHENIETTAVSLAEQEPVSFDVDLHQSKTGNVRPQKLLNDDGVQVQSNTLFVPLVGQTEPDEITVNVDETSELIDEQSQEEETIIDDEQSRLDIDHTDGDQSKMVGPDFIANLRTMLSQRYETEEKTTVIIEEKSTRKIKVNPLESREEIERHGLLDIKEPEIFPPQATGRTTVDLVNSEQGLITERTTIDDEMPSQLIKRTSLRELNMRTTTVTSTEEIKQDTTLKDTEHFEFETNNTSEVTDQAKEAGKLDGIERPPIQREPVTIYPPHKSVGITIQLIDALPEPVKQKYDGSAEIKELVVDEPEHLKKRTTHTTTNTSANSEFRESEITTMTSSDFVENVPPEIEEQRFLTEVDIPTSILDGKSQLAKGIDSEDAKVHLEEEKPLPGEFENVVSVNNEGKTERKIISPLQTTGEITVDLFDHEHEPITTKTEQKTIESKIPSQLMKQSSLRKVNGRPTAVDSTGEIMQEINSKDHENIEFEIKKKPELMDRGNEMDKLHGMETVTVDERTSIKNEPTTIYPPSRPQGITIQFIDDIPEPAKPKYVGTAVIEKIVDEPEHLKKRTIHTTTNTSARLEYYESEITNITTTDFVENIPPENAEQQFVREFEVVVPSTFVDGRPVMIKEAVSMNAYENAAIHLVQDISVPGDSESFSKTNTRDEYEKVVNEESENISISSGTSSVDHEENATVNITPNYLRRVDPSAPTTTETARAEQEMNQLNEEPVATMFIESVENREKREERSAEIKTVTGRNESEDDPGTDQEHIYARVNKQQLNIHNREEELMTKQVKTSRETVIINHHPGATTIVVADKNSLRYEETEKFDTEIQMQVAESQTVEQRFVREIENQNFAQEEISRSADIPKGGLQTKIKQQDQGLVWITVRHSKKLFDAGDTERVITLPIANKLPSDNLSPTENLDFDLENDEEMFAQRHKQEASGDYYTKKRVGEQSLERSPDHSTIGENESVLMESGKVVKRESARSSTSSKHSEDPNLPRVTTSESEVVGSEEISRRSVRETLPATDGTTTESNVWCTVKLKRWESDIRGVNWSKQSKRGDASELSSSTASVDGSYERDSSVSIKSNKDSKIVKRSSSRSTTDHEAEESIGYSMQITATDYGPLMTQEDTFSTLETLDTESTQSTNMGDATTLPWIEVRKRDSIRQRLSFKKNKRDASPKSVPHTTDGKDRLLLLKIPRTMLLEMENNEKMLDTEVEIPWMELDQSSGETQGYLPWVELADQTPHTQTDGILMLKISRHMILKASKESTGEESEIQLPWNEVVRYWEETGQITPGSLSRTGRSVSANIAITFPSESASESQLLEENPNLPDMRLILPKKCCLDGSLRYKPMIMVNEKRNIKVRINKTVKRKHDWSTLLRLSKSERRKKYSRATGQDDWVVLADGTKWWRLQVDDMDEFNKLRRRSDGQKFENYFEISSEDTDGRESIDFNEFTKELGTKKQKQFSFVIDPKNFLTSSMSF